MLLPLSTVLRDFTGDTFKLGPNRPDLTLEDVFLLGIKTPLQGDEQMSLIDKLDIARLGKAIYSGANEASEAQVELVRSRISRVLGAPALTLAIEEAIAGIPPVIPKTVIPPAEASLVEVIPVPANIDLSDNPDNNI